MNDVVNRVTVVFARNNGNNKAQMVVDSYSDKNKSIYNSVFSIFPVIQHG